jgi:hypothetical protein
VKKPWKWLRPRRELFVATNDARIGLAELEHALWSVEPAARLVPPRLLRRVVRLHTSLPGMGFRVPHSKTYVIPQEALLAIADRDEIGFGLAAGLPEDVILLERPHGEMLEEWPRGEILLYYWQLLFHARVHAAFGRLVRQESLTYVQQRFGAAETEKRLAALGSLEFDEIRNVLGQERFLLPPYDDPSTYVEFAAVYLGIRYFQPYLMASFFPALESLEKVDQIIAQDIDAEQVLEATRLPGTPRPEELREAARVAAEAFDADPLAVVPDRLEEPRPGAPGAPRERAARWARRRHRSEEKYQYWRQQAQRQAARGNLAGAAIRSARAEFWAPRERAAEAATALREDVHGLVDRLLTALGIAGDEPRPWREALLALAHQAPRGLWTVEARLLYDLQKVCVDQGRTTSTIDVMQWILTLTARPVRRELPNQRLVLVTRHLRSAQRRLPAVRISDRQRRQLAEVLGAATRTAETLLRESFRPKLVATLDEVGLLPQNLVEAVSRRKLVEELLDRIVERGFLTLGEVRDAVSRNHLKQPDCAGPGNFLRGDAVLRLNRRLTVSLDGVYERGDFYQRWIQRFSLLAFGTFLGRCLTKYLAIPFGGALVTLKFLEHLVHMVTGEEEFYAPTWSDWRSYGPTALIGIVIFGLMHSPRFRGAFREFLKLAGQTLRLVLFDPFRWFFSLPLVRRILGSSAILFLFRYVVKPLVPTLVVARRILPHNLADWPAMLALGTIFVLLNVLINSRFGRDFEEGAIDWGVESWHRFGIRFLTGLFWWFVDLFRRIMQLIERLMYAVDEWLRFKSGQGRLLLVLKGALGTVWFFVAYAIRFCVNLLIEPQLNPLKHVPWVTVSHKVIAPLFIASPLRGFLEARMGVTAGATLFAGITLGTPGIFGYLIWELKENWRLFAANRSHTLDPVLVGAHGESLPRLLRPGLHSGTIPKRFAKLRRAERKAATPDGDPGAVRKHRQVLHHVETDLRRYIEREFVAWFIADRASHPQVGTRRVPRNGYPPPLEKVHLATNRASVEVEIPGALERPLVLAFQLIEGRTHLALSGELRAASLSDSARRTLRMAILNLLKTGGVEVFDYSSEEATAADNAWQHLEIGTWAMPWPEWVATWETGRDLRDLAPWDRLGEI